MPPEPLDGLSPFAGAGIYAIYYVGGFGPYEPIASSNLDNRFAMPIYVGKAIPAGGRKGIRTKAQSTPLWSRIDEHAGSIREANNLTIADFFCRYLVVEDIWIPLGESLLIAKFSPIWNTLVDGFGNHDPGAGRYNGKIPRWDVVHPGRPWAPKCKPRAESAEDIIREIETFLRSSPDSSTLPLLLREEPEPFEP